MNYPLVFQSLLSSLQDANEYDYGGVVVAELDREDNQLLATFSDNSEAKAFSADAAHWDLDLSYRGRVVMVPFAELRYFQREFGA